MAHISTEELKKLRDETGISVMQCKKALEEAEGDMEKAKIILRKQSAQAAQKKADRELGAGIIRSYVHTNSKVGVLLELHCETDFVAQNNEFIQLADDIALHIVAMNPAYISMDMIDATEKERITNILREEVQALDKPEDIQEKILEGKVNDYFSERVLLQQPFVKNPEITVSQLIEGLIQKIGEKIALGRFVRYGLLEA